MYTKANGRFRFQVQHRHVQGDNGLAIHVHGPTSESADEEILRFDCFAEQPHYHIGWSYRDAAFIEIDSDKPFEWALTAIEERLPELLSEADALPMTEEECDAMSDVVCDLRNGASAA